MSKTPAKLRPWQVDHLRSAKAKIQNSTATPTVFLSQAVTGAGKTTYGVQVAKWLYESGLVTSILVFCPSTEIAQGWVDKLNAAGILATLENKDAPDVVAVVCCYHSAKSRKGGAKTLLILDEIHHAEREAEWGLAASAVAKVCKVVLALTGTPWMTSGRIAILNDHGYYKEGDDGVVRVQADETYNYADDLKARGNDRATVPLECTFFGNTATQITMVDGHKTPVTLRLEDVPDSAARERIADPKRTRHDVSLMPHVTINDNLLSNNEMARRMLSAAIVERHNIEKSPAFVEAKKFGVRPIGLVSCRNIKEARRVAEYLEEIHSESVEVIASDETSSADRLREISTGYKKDKKTPAPAAPDWIVSVGMVSEGVDIPAIKVVVLLNQITTLLFLIQLIGRALRRVPVRFVKNKSGVDVQIFADGGYDAETDTVVDYFNATCARIFAPAHPVIVRVATELEKIVNEAMQERKNKGGEPQEPRGEREAPEWQGASGSANKFYRGAEVPFEIKVGLNAIESDPSYLSEVGPHWVDMIRDWLRRGKFDDVKDEIERRINELGVVIEEDATNYDEKISYDVETSLLKKEAKRLVGMIRFTPAFRERPDEFAYAEVRKIITQKVVGRWVEFPKLPLEKKREWVRMAQRMHRELSV